MNRVSFQKASVSSGLTVQGRVIFALILREIHTLYGNTKLGYLWAILQTSFSIGVFWGIREFVGASTSHGMDISIFLLCGFIPWNIFIDTLNRCMQAVKANQALLTFPQVTELDLMLARTTVVWGTQILCACVFLFAVIICGKKFEIRFPESLASTLIFSSLLGLGAGLTIASLARLWNPLDKIIPMCTRLLFFSSGIFFEVSKFPSSISKILLLNPVAQLIEWQRYGCSNSSIAPIYDVMYIFEWCIVLLFLGLLLERYVRGKEL